MSADPELRGRLTGAVLEDPDDDKPRLVFADWLMERNDPRGEFISIQVALAAGALVHSTRLEFRSTSRFLLEEHQAGWTAPLDIQAVFRFRRGFVEELTTSTDLFLERAEHVFGLEPVEQLSLWGCAEGSLEALAGASWPEKLRALKLRGAGALGRKNVRIVTSLEGLSGLRSLNLGDCGLDTKDGAAIASSKTLSSLQMIGLSGNDIGDAGAAALSSSSNLAGCTRLYLGRNGITDAGIKTLAASPHLGALERLGLDGNEIDEAGIKALVESSSLPNLKRLELRGVEVSKKLTKAVEDRFLSVHWW